MALSCHYRVVIRDFLCFFSSHLAENPNKIRQLVLGLRCYLGGQHFDGLHYNKTKHKLTWLFWYRFWLLTDWVSFRCDCYFTDYVFKPFTQANVPKANPCHSFVKSKSNTWHISWSSCSFQHDFEKKSKIFNPNNLSDPFRRSLLCCIVDFLWHELVYEWWKFALDQARSENKVLWSILAVCVINLLDFHFGNYCWLRRFLR